MDKQISEIMNITLEECAEVTQAISKVFRFGFSGANPKEPDITNLMHLEEEIGDLLCMVYIMIEKGIIDRKNVLAAAENKREKLKRWSSIDLTIPEVGES